MLKPDAGNRFSMQSIVSQSMRPFHEGQERKKLLFFVTLYSMTAQCIMVNNIFPNCEEILIDCYHKYLNRVTFREPFYFKTLIVGIHDK